MNIICSTGRGADCHSDSSLRLLDKRLTLFGSFFKSPTAFKRLSKEAYSRNQSSDPLTQMKQLTYSYFDPVCSVRTSYTIPPLKTTSRCYTYFEMCSKRIQTVISRCETMEGNDQVCFDSLSFKFIINSIGNLFLPRWYNIECTSCEGVP